MLARPRTLPVGFIQPCLPIKAPKPPTGAAWLHEIKHDGYRLMAATLEEAKAQFQKSWDAWKAWAKLEEVP
jgi:bifunctional non-homologous end joining protein LigD